MALLEQIGGTESTVGISRLTIEHLYWKVLSNNSLDGSVVSVAFAEGEDVKPEVSDWNPAEVVTDPDDIDSKAIRLLVGPGEVDLTPSTTSTATYRVWVKIAIGGQEIVRRVGTLVVR